MILQTLRTTFVCKSLPNFFPPLRFFSASQAGFESSQDTLDTEILKRREKMSRWDEERYFKAYTDPDYNRKFRRYKNKSRRRFSQDPKNRETIARWWRAALERQRQDPYHYIKKNIRTWLKSHAWVRDELDWKSHTPVYYGVKVVKTCESCNIEQAGGHALWWQRKYDPSLFDCPACFFGPGPDPRKAFPRGCEDVTTLSQLRARKQELDRGMKPGSLSKKRSSGVSSLGGPNDHIDT